MLHDEALDRIHIALHHVHALRQFFTSLGISHWYIILGLIIGGSLAAPFGARLAGKLPQKTALLLVAFLVIVFSIRMLLKIF